MTHLPLIFALSNRTFAEQEVHAEIARIDRLPRRRWFTITGQSDGRRTR